MHLHFLMPRDYGYQRCVHARLCCMQHKRYSADALVHARTQRLRHAELGKRHTPSLYDTAFKCVCLCLVLALHESVMCSVANTCEGLRAPWGALGSRTDVRASTHPIPTPRPKNHAQTRHCRMYTHHAHHATHPLAPLACPWTNWHTAAGN